MARRETGLLVPPASPAALTRAIEEFVVSEHLRVTLARRARMEVEERYDFRANIDAYARMLARCAGKPLSE